MRFRFILDRDHRTLLPTLHIAAEGLVPDRDVISHVQPMVFFNASYGEDIPNGPALTEMTDADAGLIEAFLQGALEAAWAMGLRPSEMSQKPAAPDADLAGEIGDLIITPDEAETQALKDHLADMRRIAFHLLRLPEGLEVQYTDA